MSLCDSNSDSVVNGSGNGRIENNSSIEDQQTAVVLLSTKSNLNRNSSITLPDDATIVDSDISIQDVGDDGCVESTWHIEPGQTRQSLHFEGSTTTTTTTNISNNQQQHISTDQFDNQKLHQTTQSLMIASSLIADYCNTGRSSACSGSGTGTGSVNSKYSVLNNRYKSLNLFGSMESMDSVNVGGADIIQQIQPQQQQHQQSLLNSYTTTLSIDIEEVIRENQILRENLKEITTDRDRLLCEVANLRLELDMAELKRLPKESFPQKPVERNDSVQYRIGNASGGGSSGASESGLSIQSVAGGTGGCYVYKQQSQSQQHAGYSTTQNAPIGGGGGTINYLIASGSGPQQQQQQQPQHTIIQQQQQHSHHHYPSCHQQQQIIHYPNVTATSVSAGGGLIYQHHGNLQQHHHQQQQQQQHPQYYMPAHHHHHHHHGGAIVIAGSGVGTGIGSGGAVSPSVVQSNLTKKGGMRNGGEILKRPRVQTAYELSQDLLEKKIELLERKYGGVRARNAAITIQRAFRHFMMVKKFASITAMAKAEKRLCRRMGGMTIVPSNSSVDNDMVNAIGMESQLDVAHSSPSTTLVQSHGSHSMSQQTQSGGARVTIMAASPGNCVSNATGGMGMGYVTVTNPTMSATNRTPPTRSLSMRERRPLDGSPIPRSQSGTSSVSANTSSSPSASIGSVSSTGHPHVNLLHAAEQHNYATGGGHYIAIAPSAQYYQNYYAVPNDASFASSGNSSQLDSSLNSSWISASGSSPNTPYYSASQIYMRPKGSGPGTIIHQHPHQQQQQQQQQQQISAAAAAAAAAADRKRIPPEVPKRTSSITAQQHAHQQQMQQQQQLQQQQQQQQQQHHLQQQQMLLIRQTPPLPTMLRTTNGLCKTSENGSLTSVQSSGSDSSATSTDRIANSDIGSDRSNSPNTWKRGTNLACSTQQLQHVTVSVGDQSLYTQHGCGVQVQPVRNIPSGMSVLSGMSGGNVSVGHPDDSQLLSSHTSAAQYEHHEQQEMPLNSSTTATTQNYKVSETLRKRQYRVGLNLFNKKPEKGITYLIRRGFLENTPQGVARFLASRKGLSRQMIGEYLGNLQNQFNMAVLNCFAMELDLSGMQVDVALRKFQTYFRMPGEAQKIERLMEVFSQRYCQCNPDIVGRLRSSETIFVLAFAIIMLNTDLHTPNLKPERRMRLDDFIKNLRGIDDCHDIEREMLAGIYERVKANEFKPGSDHVTQMMKVQATIVGKKPNLALPHRRLVCYCRLYEIPDINKKERPGVHQREVFLFNDLLVITKIFSKKKSTVTYTFRNSFPLCGMVVSLLDVTNYPFCIQLLQKVDGKVLITFNARNEHDRCKFAEDLKESISEMDEMEALRIEAELERQKSARNRATSSSDNRDSGVADVEVCPCPYQAVAGRQANEAMANCGNVQTDASQQLKRSALSNSLLDMHEQFGNDKPQRRGSVGSLDSGMSISFQSTTTSSASRENAAVIAAAANAAASKIRYHNLPTATTATVTSTMGTNDTLTAALQPLQAFTTDLNLLQQHQVEANALLMQQQQQQLSNLHGQHQHQHQHQQSSTQSAAAVATATNVAQRAAATTTTRERKASRSDENGHSTEV